MERNNKKLFEIPAIAVIDNIVVSKKETWVYYKISEKPFLFLSTDAKINMTKGVTTALAGLCRSADKKVDCHIIISNEPFNPVPWLEDVTEKWEEYNKNRNTSRDIFENFITKQAYDLSMPRFKKRIALLGVKLTNRGALENDFANPLEVGFKEAISKINKGIKRVFDFKMTSITEEEEHQLRNMEKTIYNSLNNSELACKRATPEELLLNMKRRLYPAMPTPYLETDYYHRIGLSDIVAETGAVIEEQSHFLKITQIYEDMELTGYRATLSFSKLPERISMANNVNPFLCNDDILDYTVNCRFSLIPTRKMKKKLYDKMKETQDEVNNLMSSKLDTAGGVAKTIADQREMEQILENDDTPWLIGSYKITIDAPEKEDIKAIAEAIKTSYKKDEYVLTWTSGDQLDLFREEFLGGTMIKKDFVFTTNLNLLALAGINHGTAIAGDPVRTDMR